MQCIMMPFKLPCKFICSAALTVYAPGIRIWKISVLHPTEQTRSRKTRCKITHAVSTWKCTLFWIAFLLANVMRDWCTLCEIVPPKAHSAFSRKCLWKFCAKFSLSRAGAKVGKLNFATVPSPLHCHLMRPLLGCLVSGNIPIDPHIVLASLSNWWPKRQWRKLMYPVSLAI
jgi:hypothetical protein